MKTKGDGGERKKPKCQKQQYFLCFQSFVNVLWSNDNQTVQLPVLTWEERERESY